MTWSGRPRNFANTTAFSATISCLALTSCNAIFGIESAQFDVGGAGGMGAQGGMGAGCNGGGGSGGGGALAGCPDGTNAVWAAGFGNFETQSQALTAVTKGGDMYFAGSFPCGHAHGRRAHQTDRQAGASGSQAASRF